MDHNQASILEPEEVASVLKSDLAIGLSSLEARERLKKFGANKLEEDSAGKTVRRLLLSELLKYLSQFLNPLIQLLLICALISVAIGEYENAASVLLAITFVCTISYSQERRADKSLAKLTRQMPSVCKVIREGQAHELESHLLVPGDVVYLSEGQRVPADVRLFELRSLTVNESNLTGETHAQAKITGAGHNKRRMASVLSGESSLISSSSLAETNPGPAEDPAETTRRFMYQNLALMGTIVESGHSKGLVICTGKWTRYGEVYCLLKSTLQPRSPLQNNIDQLSMHLVIVSCVVIGVMSIMGIIQQRPVAEVAYYAISLAVTAIPEGLPVVVAVIMALGVLRLSKQKTIVKSLNSIETLGCVQVLCADKTGTLTRNDMTLTDIVTSELHSLSSDELNELNNEECRKQMTFNKLGGKMYSIGRLMEAGTLCNNASLDPNEPEGSASRFIGQATECAILEASIRMGFGDSRTKFDRLAETPFKPSSRRMVVQCQRRDLSNNSPMFYVKGAWEEVLESCNHYYECGLLKARSDEIWLEYVRICSALCGQGLRVLALATGPSLEELNFVGIIGINNSLREGMVSTVQKLRADFHIDVKMITGDAKDTALAIGRSLGLLEGSSEFELERSVMSGEQVQQLLCNSPLDTRDELDKALEIFSKSVFYRVDPIQKANIVASIQQLDKIVAMTGDGINDVISLKRANLSLVMGSGADVCKEVADVILVDDNLSVLVQAVIEGKGIYHKIHSFMSYQISISLTLVLLVAVSFGAKLAAPFTVIQLLYLNILTDGPPAQTLGVERVCESDLELRPRDVHLPILNLAILRRLLVLTGALLSVNGSLYFSLIEQNGTLSVKARSMLFTCFVLSSIFSAISLRSKTKTVFELSALGNMELLYCSLAVIAVQVCTLNVPFLANLFEVGPLSHLEFLLLFVYAALVLLIMDLSKVLFRLWAHARLSLDKRAHGRKQPDDLIKESP